MVLSWMADNYSSPVPLFVWLTELCESCSCRQKDLIADIKRWKEEDEYFRMAHAEYMAARGRARSDAAGPATFAGRTMDEMRPDWRVAFVEAYLRLRSRLKAAEEIGFSYESIRKRLLPGHEMFDADFKAALEQAEAELIESARADFFRGMDIAREQAESTGDARSLMWGAITYLERKAKGEFARQESHTVEGTIQHQHQLGAAAALTAVQQKALATAAAAGRGLFLEEAVDVEVVDEHQG